MGVPALFRWLSKKYPKIVLPVIEEEAVKIPNEEGVEVAIPVDISTPNPNDTEFDNLYLDMNGIVHPCTHPEGKPAPETEEEMMLEIFEYTERVVNMIRPRKLLFMAIDGVAPRAKMNQQRSRRFRSSQEAKDKEEALKESHKVWESMGKVLTEEQKNKKAWDSNAITPGTPFMDLLASSLRYWVVKKINTDPGWKTMQVYISDAGVPGEGEHKIMDFIRRQRSNPGHDPNTNHVIYGLDADLIMLSLATHEPNFRVLREDVFFQAGSATACRICGQEGHFAAQCTGTPMEKKQVPAQEKPFIFLDVAILREYLEVELNVPQPFPFNLEQAIDDWVLLIFFVGNDFLPHLPSLEIREGAIDTLLKIWRDELPRMGGYLTNNGELQMARAQIILEGLARREDDIFRRRKESEERQESSKRQRTERDRRVIASTGDAASGLLSGPSPSLQLTAAPIAPTNPVHPSLPSKPVIHDFAQKADSMGFGGAPASSATTAMAAQALGGSNSDVVANRAAIRMANMSARDVLKAEMAGLIPVKPSASTLAAAAKATAVPASLPSKPIAAMGPTATLADATEDEVPGFGSASAFKTEEDIAATKTEDNSAVVKTEDGLAAVKMETARSSEGSPMEGVETTSQRGHKRSIDEVQAEDAAADDSTVEEGITLKDVDDDDAPPEVVSALTLTVRPDGTVEQEDVVRLWEPGYRERYYRQKFGVEPSDLEFRRKLTESYVEGMAWVLRYYYQGTPSWQWYYPYHFAPFAADFEEVAKMEPKFIVGKPFNPFEQLMGVFPAASKQHIPAVFHSLMTEEDSPIIDFYPTTFEIDMNGKKMAWQGVALLPFIDETRLLSAMAGPYGSLTEDEKRRNSWRNDHVWVGEEHALYPFFETLYAKRKPKDPVPIDPKLSGGISGSVLPDPSCIPFSTYESPLASVGLADIRSDRTLSAIYHFPEQLTPHRSILLPGVRRAPRVLTQEDLDGTRRRAAGGRGRGGDRSVRGRGMLYGGGGYQGSNSHGNGGGRGGDRQDYSRAPSQRGSYNQGYSDQRQSYQPQQNYSGYGGAGRGGQQPSYGGSGRGGTAPGGNGYGGYGQLSGRGGGYGQSGGRGGGYGGYSGPQGAPPRQDYGGYGGYGGGGNQGYSGAGGRGGGNQGYEAPPNGAGNYGAQQGGSYGNGRGRGRGY